MNQNIIRTITVLSICLCFMGCGLFHRNDAKKPFQTSETPVSPQQEHFASEYLNIANGYYNQATALEADTARKLELYELSLENYKKALQIQGIESETKAKIELYIKETEELLTKIWYDDGYALVPFDADAGKKRVNAPKAIQYFQKVVDNFPNTDYADLSYVQLGLCYEYLDKLDDAESAYKKLIMKYTDKNGHFIEPFSENIRQAVRFAQDRLKKLKLMLIA